VKSYRAVSQISCDNAAMNSGLTEPKGHWMAGCIEVILGEQV
jgi:hypothetical protein